MGRDVLSLLLIENDSATVRLLQDLLRDARHPSMVLQTADDLLDGLALLAEDDFDLVLLSLALPDSGGLQNYLRVHSAAPLLPVILLSGPDERDLAQNVVHAGAQDYLVKDEIGGPLLRRAIRYAEAQHRLMIELEEYRRQQELDEDCLRTLVVHTADATLVIDDNGAICFANAAAGQLYGRPAEALVGMPFGAPVVLDETAEVDIIRGDGKHRIAEMRVADIHWLGEAARLASLRDVTARREIEAHLEWELGVNAALSSLYRPLSAPHATIEETAERVLNEALALTQSASGFVSLLDEDTGESMLLAVTDDLCEQFGFPAGAHRPLLPAGEDGPFAELWQRVEEATQPLMTTGLLPDESGAMQPVPVLVVPVVLGETPIGQILLAQPHDMYGPREVGAIEHLAEYYALAVQRRRTEAAEREQRVLAEALRDAALALNSTLEIDEVLARILTHVGRVVPHDAANILVIENGHARPQIVRGYAAQGVDIDAMMQMRFPMAETPNLKQMLETRKPFIIPDAQTYPGWALSPVTAWVRSYLGVPIMAGEDVIGFLSLDSAEPAFFTETHARRLQAFAGQVAVALGNAHHFDMAGRRAAYLAVLNDASARVSRWGVDLDKVLNAIVVNLIERADAVLARVWMPDGDDKQVLVLRASAGLSTRLDGAYSRIRIGQANSKIAELAETHEPIVVNAPAQDPRIDADWIEANQIKAFAGYPLVMNGILLAVLGVFSQAHLDDAYLNMLGSFANQAAIALQNALLYRELERYSEFLEQAVEARTRELVATTERVETILNAVGDLLMVTSAAGKIEQVNPAFITHTGYTPADVEMRHWSELLAQADEGLVAAVDAAAQAGQLWRGEVEIRRPDGKTFEAMLTFSPIMREDGSLRILVGSMVDISAQKEVERMKDAVISNVSHELRTPLSGIILNLGMLVKYFDELDADRRRNKLLDVQDQAFLLRDLIEDILALARCEAGREITDPDWFGVNMLCEAVIGALRPAIEKKQLILETSGCESPLRLWADEAQIGRVLRNLLGNAVKYTPKGGWIELSVEANGEDVLFSVADSGIGIAPQELPFVFDRFYRTADASQFASGTGLGLSISRALVEQHGGTIEVESEPGKGSVFRVRLPRHGPGMA